MLQFQAVLLILFTATLLPGRADADSELSFAIAPERVLKIVPLNAISRQPSYRDTFTLFEGKPAIITLYYNNDKAIDQNIMNISVHGTNTMKEIASYKIASSYNSYSVRIDKSTITYDIDRLWTCTFHVRFMNKYKYYTKEFFIHIIPKQLSKIANSLSKSSRESYPVILQNTQSSIGDFDGSGCLMFSGDTRLELTCHSSHGDATEMSWNYNGKPNINLRNCDENSCNIIVNIKENGSYIDCIERQNEDLAIVRLFFILSSHVTSTNDIVHSYCYDYFKRLKDISQRESGSLLNQKSISDFGKFTDKLSIYMKTGVLPSKDEKPPDTVEADKSYFHKLLGFSEKWLIVAGVSLMLICCIILGFTIRNLRRRKDVKDTTYWKFFKINKRNTSSNKNQEPTESLIVNPSTDTVRYSKSPVRSKRANHKELEDKKGIAKVGKSTHKEDNIYAEPYEVVDLNSQKNTLNASENDLEYAYPYADRCRINILVVNRPGVPVIDEEKSKINKNQCDLVVPSKRNNVNNKGKRYVNQNNSYCNVKN